MDPMGLDMQKIDEDQDWYIYHGIDIFSHESLVHWDRDLLAMAYIQTPNITRTIHGTIIC